MAHAAHSTRDPDAMRYIMRDDMGEIAAVFARPQHDGEGPIAMEDPELLAFVAGGDPEAALRSYLAGTDAELLRIAEDLVNVLIDRNLIKAHGENSSNGQRFATNFRTSRLYLV